MTPLEKKRLQQQIDYILFRLEPEQLKETILNIFDDIEQEQIAPINSKGLAAWEDVQTPEGRAKAKERREDFKKKTKWRGDF